MAYPFCGSVPATIMQRRALPSMNEIQKLSEDPRVAVRKPGEPDPAGRCIVYWMQRAQRALDNPALEVAVKLGNELRKPVVIFFAPVPFYPHANARHYSFLAEGIPEIAEAAARRDVGFVLRTYPEHSLLRFCDEVRAAIVVGDENPLREPGQWRERVARQIRAPLWTVDADVIVPSKLLLREQYAARTIRPRIHKLLPEFLVRQGNPKARVPWVAPRKLAALSLGADFTAEWKLDRSVERVACWRGGTRQGMKMLRAFVRRKLASYPELRNRPEQDGTSRLSPYLHFGHISPLTVALAVKNAQAPARAKDAFLDQLIVQRELAVNFVRFNPSYDAPESLEPWAGRSFAEHAGDHRPFVYNDEQLENAETHDPLWNAAQKQMVLTGWMHNYMRMYWAKKILEWSPSVAAAMKRAIWLNDKYQLDGRDPDGYAGIAWAILGKHDRAWSERPIFGKVRYMSMESTGRKFDSKKYIAQSAALEDGRA
jgi:deoxyribodipyrimidine photo-lyase